MNDIVPVIVAGCGLSIICVGLLAVGIIVLIRFTGSSILGNMGNLGFLSQFLNPGESDYTAPTPQRSRGQRPNFRQRAQSQDFEDIVASKRQQNPPPAFKGDSQSLRRPTPGNDSGFRPIGGGTPPPPIPPSTPAKPAAPADLGSTDYTGKYSKNPRFGSRRRRDDRNQDEVFGGMLDEDGDGDLDF